jgi:hypothetical protein
MHDRLQTQVPHCLPPVWTVASAFHSVPIDGQEMRIFMKQSVFKAFAGIQHKAAQDDFSSLIKRNACRDAKLFPNEFWDIAHWMFFAELSQKLTREDLEGEGHSKILLLTFRKIEATE